MKQCRDPRHNRIAGCIMTAGGLLLMMRAPRYPTAEDPYNGKNWFLIVLSAAVLIWSVIWMVKTVRCPHCHQILNLKISNIDICPGCGNPVDPDFPADNVKKPGGDGFWQSA